MRLGALLRRCLFYKQETYKRHSLRHTCRSVASGSIEMKTNSSWDNLTFDPHVLCFRRSALTVGDGRVGEGEPGPDGGSGHPGGPAVVQRGRRGDTTGETEHTDEDMHVCRPLQRRAWEWCHRKRRQCSSCYRAGKKISHFQQWEVTEEETWCKSISGERARAQSTKAWKRIFRFVWFPLPVDIGVISHASKIICAQIPWSVYGFIAGVRVALRALRFLTPAWRRHLFVSRHRSFRRKNKLRLQS